MKLQDENEALRAQMRLRMEDTDSRHERMQSMMLMISNLTTKLQAENSSIYSQLLKVSDLTSGLQAENDSIYLQLLKVSDLTSWLQAENNSIYTQLLNVGDLMAGLQSDNSSIYSQLQALSADVIQRRAQYEEQHTALQEKVRMLQTQTTNLDSNLSKRSSTLEERLTSHVTQLQQKDQELVQMVIRRTSVDLIGFHARLTNDVDAPNPKTLVLDRVEYNAGGGYDSTTGIFTAPVTGLYLFLATIGASSGDAAANVHIEVNGHARTGCFSKYSTNIELSTCHGADRVVKGQQVRIVTERDKRRIRGGWWTTFTVVLIQRED
ncbi:uncharacterized protein LOC112575516 [Pomacea canaliculata]|uniref:uncharacterized protein LOC112575516 n=1 Tax=Pomacea canaliculata TaxID=400727 RepID=UPI000D729968|nr:uncharacterized protein LOC112575516 [Pomacea canaliculata]